MRFSILLIITTLLAPFAKAQEPLVEGTISYNVYLQPANGQESLGSQAGVYTLTVKGNQVRRELRMNNGYQSIVLYDGKAGSGHILQATPANKFAIALNAAEMAKRRVKWEGISYKTKGGTETVGGQSCTPTQALYPNGSVTNMCLSNVPLAESFIYSRFPGIKTIPLNFDYQLRDGASIRFQLEKINVGPVETNQFRVPTDYKVLSSEELKNVED
jgi:hypothetical protein